ncbi:PAS domain S-box protein [Methylocapsa sp. S129]|uniref:PAS domain S-box protein n=1 Tax=Methylocapsa sp. S129 TaxID=1641869 RepID=UPI00131C47A1|nr:PAS domain S-box protein [Methylocapsa sp. S129]
MNETIGAKDTQTGGTEPASLHDANLSVDAILEGIGEGFLALGPDWRFTAFNRAAEEIFGMPRAHVVGRLLWDVSPTVVGAEFERRYRRVMSERIRQDFESYSALQPDRYHEVRAFPLGDGIGVAFRDITHRRKVNQALRDRELELTRVQQIGGIGGLEVDLRNGFRSRRSPEYLHLHGLPASAVNETHEQWVQRIHPEDRQWVEKYFLDTVASLEKHYKAEYRIIRPSDGQMRWIRAVAEIERDEEGRALTLIGAHLDISDRKEAERAARESEERLRATTDALPLLISYIDKDRVFRFANKRYEAWFDRPVSEIVGRKISDVMSAAMYEARRSFVDRALAGETVSYEADFARPDGALITEVVHVPHRDEAGRVLGMYVVVQDITDRKLAEKALGESEARFRSIANSAPVPIWVSRLDGRREFVNRAYVDFLGVPLAEALNLDWRKALHPDDLDRILDEQRVGEGSRRPFALEARYRRSDGQWRWLRSESQPRWNPAGEHAGFIGVAHDLTASKEAEQELTQLNETLERRIEERTAQLIATEALIKTFFRHSSECHAVMVEADEGRFRYEEVNPATLRLYNMTRRQVIGSTVDELFGAENAAEVNGHLTACLRAGAPYRYERMQGGAVVEAIATPVPQEAGSRRRLVVSARDVTERRHLEQQLRQAQKMEAVGQLTGGVAHDFNNLLTLVIGGLDVIDRQIPKLPATDALARIERARGMALQGAERAAALTSRLLAFSRQQALTPQPLDANMLVASVCDLLRRTLGETIALETALAEGLWRAFADSNQLENALLNLALNARDAMPGGGKLTIETANCFLDHGYVALLSEPVAPGQYVMIAVADTGEGMDQATRERAFDPFFTTKEVGKGTGLGLSQVYGFARQSSGHVKIYSEAGEGTTVKIYLPRHLGAVEGVKVDAPVDTTRLVGTESILVVEDEEALRTYTSEILHELGYRVLEAGSGAAALEILDGGDEVDLLLTDVVMPGGLNGRELADEARRKRPGLKVIFMTGYTRNAIVHHGRLDAGVDLIGKPFAFHELAERIRKRLDAAG